MNTKPSGKTLTIFIDLKKAVDTNDQKNILEKITGKCQLCTRENFNIVSELASLNIRHEVSSGCRHKDGKLLVKAPD